MFPKQPDTERSVLTPQGVIGVVKGASDFAQET